MLRPLALGFTLLLSALTAHAANADRHVVLISLDNFPVRLWRDPALPVPNLRRLAASGVAAEAMTPVNPTVTWINHTSLITGVSPRRHGVLFNGLLVRDGPGRAPHIEQWVDKTKLVFAPTLYDVGRAAGLTTAESDWVAVTRAQTMDWSFPEIPNVGGAVEKEMIADGQLTAEEIGWMQHKEGRKSITVHDEIWTRAACFMFARHRPNLLLYHTLTTDSVHHEYGPGTLASYAALANADKLVGQLLQTIEASGLADRTTILVTTDHGSKRVSRWVYPNVILKQAGYSETAGPKLVRADVAAMSQGGMSFIYVTDPARKAELLPKVKTLFAATEGVAEVIDAHDAVALGYPTPEENPGMGDLVLYPKDGYVFNDSPVGDAASAPTVNYGGTHGQRADDPDLEGIFIASGAGIKRGAVLGRMRNLDVAPTIARLLGLQLPQVEGRVLDEILVSTK